MTTYEAVEIIEGPEADVPGLYLEAFQSLIDSGVVWQLQGFYGRTAATLIATGDCTPKED